MLTVLKFSLIEWKDDGCVKYSVVESNCVRGFEFTSHAADGTMIGDNSVVVEWRKGKRGKLGWPCYDAKLIRSSGDKTILEKEMSEMIEAIEGNTDEEPPLKRIHVPTFKALEISKPQKAVKVDKMKKFSSDQRASSDKQLLEEVEKKYGDTINQRNSGSEELEQQLENLKAENQKLKALVLKEVPKMMNQMAAIMKMYEKKPANFSQSCDYTQESSSPTAAVMSSQSISPKTPVNPGAASDNDENSMVEIAPGVMADRLCVTRARHALSATQCARILLLALFDTQTLLDSTLKGGSSKREPNGPARHPLDETKLNAIYNFTSQRFPAVSLANIGVAISGKLTEMRLSAKKSTTA